MPCASLGLQFRIVINIRYVPSGNHTVDAAAVVLVPFDVFLPPFASFAAHSQELEPVDAFVELSLNTSTLR